MKNLRILLIGGDHNRHLYYSNVIHGACGLAGSIIQKREDILPVPPEFHSDVDKHNYDRHFQERAAAELKYFGEQSMPDCDKLVIGHDELNSQKTVDFINKIGPDVVFIFGCGMIREPLSGVLPKATINMHLGLSPRYRGAATLFWPFYFLEPNYAGATFHYISNEPDAGNIIHQVVPDLEVNDGIHDVACKVVLKAAAEVVQLVDIYKTNGSWENWQQKATGKNFLNSDFRPEHLRMIYNVFDNDIVKYFLENKLSRKELKIRRQFN